MGEVSEEHISAVRKGGETYKQEERNRKRERWRKGMQSEQGENEWAESNP